MLASTLKQRLLGFMPRGMSTVVDTADDTDLSRYFGVMADVVKNYGTDMADKLAQEVCPLTAVDVLPTWESALGLRGSRAALGSSVTARQAQLLSRLRERGPLTLGKIRAVLGPLLGYADPSQLVIKTTSRSELRTLHTYPTGTSLPLTLPGTLDFWVRDDALVSDSGVQVDITLTTTALENIACSLVVNSTLYYPFSQNLGSGSVTSKTFRIFVKSAAGAAIGLGGMGGLISLIITGSGSVSTASCFAEGIGRTSVRGNGRGSAFAWWAAVYEPSKSTSAPDLDAAHAAIARIDQGTRRGSLCQAMSTGALGMIPGDTNALPGSITG